MAERLAETGINAIIDAASGPRANYYNLDANFKELGRERDKLKARMDEWNKIKSRHSHIGMEPSDAYKGWFKKMEKMLKEIDDLLGTDDNPNFPKSCLGGFLYENIFEACSKSQEVYNVLKEVKTFRLQEVEVAVEQLFKPVVVEELTIDFAIIGRKEEVASIKGQIEDGTHPVIMISGMGGVGKTALMKEVNNSNWESAKKKFDVVIWVDEENTKEIRAIQEAIGRRCGIMMGASDTQAKLATSIRNDLLTKSFLLFLDDLDIPDHATLAQIGIPIFNKDPKTDNIVFSTRNRLQFLNLNADQFVEIEVKPLNMEQASNVFRSAAGEQAAIECAKQSPTFFQRILDSCGGLPLTLNYVGRFLRIEKDVSKWKDRLEQEEKLKGQKIGNYFASKIYSKFNVRGGNLNEEEQQCFLYCSLFPRDYILTVEELVLSWLAHKYLLIGRGLCNLDEIRTTGGQIVSALERGNWLGKQEMIDGEAIVRMHETVRQSALYEKRDTFFVQSKTELQFSSRDPNWEKMEIMSCIDCHIEKLEKVKCSNLTTLILKKSRIGEIDDFFSGMVSLKILDLSHSDITKIPVGITLLITLVFLNLSYTNINDLPVEFKNLTGLELLDLSFIQNLVIPEHVMKNLSKLLYLNMSFCGADWNESFIEELDGLPSLEDLRITVTGAHSFKRLGESKFLNSIRGLFLKSCGGSLLVSVQANNGFKNLQSVDIMGCTDVVNLSWLAYIKNLKSIKVVRCTKLKEIIDSTNSSIPSLFQNLRSIELTTLGELKTICEFALNFTALETMVIINCQKMRKLPLDRRSNASSKLEIRGDQDWWDNLVWDDEDSKNSLFSFFRCITPDRFPKNAK